MFHKSLLLQGGCSRVPAMVIRLLRYILVGALLLTVAPDTAQASSFFDRWGKSQERVLDFYNTHTHETLSATFWRNGRYNVQALQKINWILRDHRSGDVRDMSYELMNYLHAIKLELRQRYPEQEIVFHVISGYRSKATNDMLRARGGGQAKTSRHMLGDAIDIRVPGIDSAEIRDIAWCLQRGGVGYYRGSDFVHIDTHKIRHWHWAPTAQTCGSGGQHS